MVPKVALFDYNDCVQVWVSKTWAKQTFVEAEEKKVFLKTNLKNFSFFGSEAPKFPCLNQTATPTMSGICKKKQTKKVLKKKGKRWQKKKKLL